MILQVLVGFPIDSIWMLQLLCHTLNSRWLLRKIVPIKIPTLAKAILSRLEGLKWEFKIFQKMCF